MPFTDTPRPRPVLLWATIQPIVREGLVSISFNNMTSRPASFFVYGVLARDMKIELDGNTAWETTIPTILGAQEVTVRSGHQDGEVIARASLSNQE